MTSTKSNARPGAEKPPIDPDDFPWIDAAVHRPTVPSTQDEAMRLLSIRKGRPSDPTPAVDAHPATVLVTADEQTAGRGRGGGLWRSAVGQNILFSLAFRRHLKPAALARTGMGVGTSIAAAVSRITGLASQVKWPNDIVVADGKLGGVLVDTVLHADGHATIVVGVGLNVNQTVFPPMEGLPPVSIALARGVETDRVPLLAAVLGAVKTGLDTVWQPDFDELDAWVGPLLWRRGEAVAVDHQGRRSGRVVGLAADGALRLQSGDGVRTVYHGTLRAEIGPTGTIG